MNTVLIYKAERVYGCIWKELWGISMTQQVEICLGDAEVFWGRGEEFIVIYRGNCIVLDDLIR